MGFFSERFKKKEEEKNQQSASLEGHAFDPYASAPRVIRDVVTLLNKEDDRNFTGERAPTNDEWEQIFRDRGTVVDFLNYLELEQGSARLEKIIVPQNVIVFSHHKNQAGEELEGAYDPLNKKVRLKESGTAYPEPRIAEHTRVHEFFHTASASADHESLSVYQKEGLQAIRLMCGFGIAQAKLPESSSPDNFFFGSFNEGVTDLLAGLALMHTKKLDGYGFHGEYTKAYAPYRYIALVLIHGLAQTFVREGKIPEWRKALREALHKISEDYINSTFSFAKTADAFFGSGTTKKLSQLHSGDETALSKFIELITDKVLTDKQRKEGMKSPDAKRLLGYGDIGMVGATLEKEIVQALQA